MPPAFNHVRTWIFDLDNTLYPASANLFALIDVRMGEYISDLLGVDAVEARRLQKQWFVDHGTTLNGLMLDHGVDPAPFLDYVHDITLDRIGPDPALADAIAALPGRKLIFTNADAVYARRVLEKRGLADCFEAVFDIHDCVYRPKPELAGYEGLCARFDVDPASALMVEDMARNLKPAKQLGMATVWVNNGSEHGHAEACPSFIDMEISDVSDWLTGK
jgi:putative hydrolase of the HAD superfamily